MYSLGTQGEIALDVGEVRRVGDKLQEENRDIDGNEQFYDGAEALDQIAERSGEPFKRPVDTGLIGRPQHATEE